MTELMNKLEKQAWKDEDPTAEERKKDHIKLAMQSQIASENVDQRFYYEPMLSGHPKKGSWGSFEFVGKTMRIPLWVSSMTGGTKMARTINHNLAMACKEFGMGMGLGSCRSLLEDDTYLSDFAVRNLIGDDAPLFANLGIAQIEQLIDSNEIYRISVLLDKLEADGLIIHVNPLQEWLQPEGDVFKRPPIESILTLLDKMDVPLIVKEVGQGFGRESLKTLLQLPLEAIDFAANGGTNFAKLELKRSTPSHQAIYRQLAFVGHTAGEMVNICNDLLYELGDKVRCKQIIVSGGVQNFLDGYYLINKLNTTAIYGQARAFLENAQGSYEDLQTYVNTQVEGLELAKAYLRIK